MAGIVTRTGGTFNIYCGWRRASSLHAKPPSSRLGRTFIKREPFQSNGSHGRKARRHQVATPGATRGNVIIRAKSSPVPGLSCKLCGTWGFHADSAENPEAFCKCSCSLCRRSEARDLWERPACECLATELETCLSLTPQVPTI